MLPKELQFQIHSPTRFSHTMLTVSRLSTLKNFTEFSLRCVTWLPHCRMNLCGKISLKYLRNATTYLYSGTHCWKSDACKLVNRPHHDKSTFFRYRQRGLSDRSTDESTKCQYGFKLISLYSDGSRAT